MPTLDELRTDLRAEHEALEAIVAGLDDDRWFEPTPATGWTIADQIGHLGYFDRTAALAINDSDAFLASISDVLDGDDAMEQTLAEPRSMTPAKLLDWWRESRVMLLAAADQLDDGDRLVWYGPPMSAKSFLTARLMETWAHGLDVADTLGVAVEPTDRLLHVAHLGVITRGFSYIVRGETPPDADVRVELAAPSGDTWEWGDAAAHDRVRGPAVDFCQVVTQRRHVADTELEVSGARAVEWMGQAQAFAGGPGPGRQPGEFARGSGE